MVLNVVSSNTGWLCWGDKDVAKFLAVLGDLQVIAQEVENVFGVLAAMQHRAAESTKSLASRICCSPRHCLHTTRRRTWRTRGGVLSGQ